MPDPKDNTKLSGDTHPPEVEDERDAGPEGRADAQGTPPEPSLGRDLEKNQGRAGTGSKQAGLRKGKGAPGAGR